MITFIETKAFTRLVGEYLSDDEYAALERALFSNPALRDLVRRWLRQSAISVRRFSKAFVRSSVENTDA